MPSFKINPDHIMQAVYSYPFPEVRAVLDRHKLPAAFMLNTLPVEKAQEYLSDYNFTPRLKLPVGPDGALDLDELHVPVIARIRQHLNVLLPGLDSFTNAYPTPGSSQAMFTLMAEWKAKGELTSLAVLEGEYEGYAAYAESLNIPVTVYHDLAVTTPKTGEMWFISNPSAIDGNLINPAKWTAFVAAGHQIVYDAAYIGLITEGTVEVSAPNIRAVLVSPSKVFGVFRYRHTGLCFTRQAVSALYGTKWFKDIPALIDTLLLYETFAPCEIPKRYKAVQNKLCAALSSVVGGDVQASDTLLLAHTEGPVKPNYRKYSRRENAYRFGLTKLFEDSEVSSHHT